MATWQEANEKLHEAVKEFVAAEFSAPPYEPSGEELTAGESSDAQLLAEMEGKLEKHGYYLLAMQWAYQPDAFLNPGRDEEIAANFAYGLIDVIREAHRARELLRSPSPESHGGHA